MALRVSWGTLGTLGCVFGDPRGSLGGFLGASGPCLGRLGIVFDVLF